MNKRLVGLIETCNLSCDSQYGFRSSCSTVDFLIIVSDRINADFLIIVSDRINTSFNRSWAA